MALCRCGIDTPRPELQHCRHSSFCFSKEGTVLIHLHSTLAKAMSFQAVISVDTP